MPTLVEVFDAIDDTNFTTTRIFGALKRLQKAAVEARQRGRFELSKQEFDRIQIDLLGPGGPGQLGVGCPLNDPRPTDSSHMARNRSSDSISAQSGLKVVKPICF